MARVAHSHRSRLVGSVVTALLLATDSDIRAPSPGRPRLVTAIAVFRRDSDRELHALRRSIEHSASDISGSAAPVAWFHHPVPRTCPRPDTAPPRLLNPDCGVDGIRRFHERPVLRNVPPRSAAEDHATTTVAAWTSLLHDTDRHAARLDSSGSGPAESCTPISAEDRQIRGLDRAAEQQLGRSPQFRALRADRHLHFSTGNAHAHLPGLLPVERAATAAATVWSRRTASPHTPLMDRMCHPVDRSGDDSRFTPAGRGGVPLREQPDRQRRQFLGLSPGTTQAVRVPYPRRCRGGLTSQWRRIPPAPPERPCPHSRRRWIRRRRGR